MLVDLEGHGREALFDDVDVSRTVGWFTSLFPVGLEVAEGAHPGEALKAVKEQLRRVPQRGIGYGVLRYLSEDKALVERLRALPQAEISFNYLGQLDQGWSETSPFQLAREIGGVPRSWQGSGRYLIEVNGRVTEGRLQLDWTYRENIYRHATVELFALHFVQALRTLITHCTSQSGDHTPSDFPLARLDWHKLGQLMEGDRQIEDIYPLSSTQQGILFHTLLTPKSVGYSVRLSCTLHGHLMVSAFKRGLQQVVARHPILRTSFVWEGLYEPLQVVHGQVELPWAWRDWQELSPIEQQTRLEAHLQIDRNQGFDLSKAPLMRLSLVQVAETTYQFIWDFHHLLLDGWSVSLLLKEVFAYYEAFCQGQNLHLECGRPYRDYIAWLRQQDLSQKPRRSGGRHSEALRRRPLWA